MKLRRGFTIVEILIVIVVIAILATVTIVSYNNVIRNSAEQSMKVDLQDTAAKLATYRKDHGEVPDTLLAELKTESKDNTLS